VVGHQPVLGQVIARLIGLGAADFAVKKGALWWLRHQERVPDSETLVLAVRSPEAM